MYRTTSVLALGLFFGLAPVGALAQTQTDDTNTQLQTTQPPAAEQSTETETLQIDETQQSTETETLQTDETPEVAADAGEAETPEVIPQQEDSQMLASSLLGSSVTLADESIGTVSDLIISDDHTVTGVVVGVGGFLGIGEKRVALPLERISIRTIGPGEVELAADMTREELEAKEAFKTASQVKAEQEAERTQQEMEMQQQQQQQQIPQ